VWQVKATGMGLADVSHGQVRIPRTSAKAAREVKGFRTGDMVQSVVPSGKKAGTHIGKVAVRASGSFNVSTMVGVVQGISHKHCSMLHRADGYSIYQKQRSSRLSKTEYPRPGGFMKVLIVGGRKRACNSMETFTVQKVDKIYCTPGNAGIAELAECIEVAPDDFGALLDFVKYEW